METGQILQFEQHHRLALALERAGIDGPDMAAELGVHRNTITNYLKGHTQPSKAVLKEWARITDVPFEWLKTGADTDATIARYISRMAHPTAHVHQLVLDIAS